MNQMNPPPLEIKPTFKIKREGLKEKEKKHLNHCFFHILIKGFT